MMDWTRLLHTQRLGHDGAEPVAPGRSPFQKDWDRIIFSSAFRRLQDKTQVHSLPESDYVRNRLTHSLEVASVGRSLGAAVGATILDRHFHKAHTAITPAEFGHIVAAACLGHDIGNPPFGHYGEDIIRHWFKDSETGRALIAPLSPAEQADFLTFEGNAQGFRVMARLQNWRDRGGLRLTAATLATFAKYPFGVLDEISHPRIKFGYFQAEADLFRQTAETVGLKETGPGHWVRHPLAYLVEAADDICYRIVDIEDGFKIGRLPFARVEALLQDIIGRDLRRYEENNDQPRKIAHLRAKAIGRLIDDAASVFLDHEAAITAGQFKGELLDHVPACATLLEIARLTREEIFETPERYRGEIAGSEILETLLEYIGRAWLAHESGAPLSPRHRSILRLLTDLPSDGAPLGRYEALLCITDYISGMTDGFALAQFRLFKGFARE